MSLLSNQAYLITVTAPEIQQLHAQAGARFGTLNGVEVVLDYGDVQAEYQALRNTAGVLDLSFRGRLCLTGVDRVSEVARMLGGDPESDVSRAHAQELLESAAAPELAAAGAGANGGPAPQRLPRRKR